MAVYFVTGKLGSGKSLVCVGKIQDYLHQKRRVATNLDIYTDKLMSRKNKQPIIRLPDKPRPVDLINLGYGTDKVDEDTNGLIVLDECGTWLNSRTWNDPERAGFVDWMLHARKYGWDILFIIQDISIVDKQIRMTMCEHLVMCRRLDRIRVPFLSSITQAIFGIRLTLPKIHRAKVHYGDNEQSIVSDVWSYRGHHLYPAYDTRQVFSEDKLTLDDNEVDMRASYTLLSHWHIAGRYYQRRPLFNITNPIQLLLIPTWLLVQAVSKISNTPARSSGVLRSSS